MTTIAPPAADRSATTPKALAITALVLGIVSLIAAFFGWAGIILGLAALVLGIIALKRSQPKGMSITAIVTGSLGLLGGIAMVVITMILMAIFGAAVDVLETGDLSQLEQIGVEFETE